MQPRCSQAAVGRALDGAPSSSVTDLRAIDQPTAKVFQCRSFSERGFFSAMVLSSHRSSDSRLIRRSAR